LLRVRAGDQGPTATRRNTLTTDLGEALTRVDRAEYGERASAAAAAIAGATIDASAEQVGDADDARNYPNEAREEPA
jgi:hypothetical protein